MKKNIFLICSLILGAGSLYAQANSLVKGGLNVLGAKGSGMAAFEALGKDLVSPIIRPTVSTPSWGAKKLFYFDSDAFLFSKSAEVNRMWNTFNNTTHEYQNLRRIDPNFSKNILRRNLTLRVRINEIERTIEEVNVRARSGVAPWKQEAKFVSLVDYNLAAKHGDTMFDVNEEVASLFKTKSRDLLDVTRYYPQQSFQKLSMGTLPPIYEFCGMSEMPLLISGYSIRKALGRITPEELTVHPDWHNHNVPLEVIENLPELIADPVAIFKSDGTESSLVAVIDRMQNGYPIFVPLKRRVQDSYVFIPTLYEKNTYYNTFKASILRREMFYVDIDRKSPVLDKILEVFNDTNVSISTVMTKRDLARAIVWSKLGLNPNALKRP